MDTCVLLYEHGEKLCRYGFLPSSGMQVTSLWWVASRCKEESLLYHTQAVDLNCVDWLWSTRILLMQYWEYLAHSSKELIHFNDLKQQGFNSLTTKSDYQASKSEHSLGKGFRQAWWPEGSLGPTWWKEQNDSPKLSSYLFTCVVTHMPSLPLKNKIIKTSMTISVHCPGGIVQCLTL